MATPSETTSSDVGNTIELLKHHNYHQWSDSEAIVLCYTQSGWYSGWIQNSTNQHDCRNRKLAAYTKEGCWIHHHEVGRQQSGSFSYS